MSHASLEEDEGHLTTRAPRCETASHDMAQVGPAYCYCRVAVLRRASNIHSSDGISTTEHAQKTVQQAEGGVTAITSGARLILPV